MNGFSIPEAPGWFNGMLNLSLQATLLAGLVWMVLKAVGRWIPPSWRALMWFLVIARVLIPYAPPSPLSWQNLFTTESAPAVSVVQEMPQEAPIDLPVGIQFATPVETISLNAAPLSPAQTKPIRYTRVFTMIWGGAASILIALLVGRALMIRYRLALHGLPAPAFILELLRACCAELRLRYPIRVTASDRIAAPALTGLIPAQLIIPKIFAPPQFTLLQIRQILLHELAHVQQGHLLLHWLALIARAIHWFNPAIHFAAIRLRQECELAADAATLKNAAAEERAAYGETMLKVLENSITPRTLLALGMAEETRHLKERLSALTQPAQPRSCFLAIALLSAVIVCGFSSASPTGRNDVQNATLSEAKVRGVGVAMNGNSGLPTNTIKEIAGATTNVTRRTTVQEARRMIVSGDITGAEALLQRAVNDGTIESVATEMTTILQPITNIISIAANLVDTNKAALNPGRKRLLEKLATIRIDDFPLPSNVDLVEVLHEVSSEVRRRDPNGTGVNLIISQAADRSPNATSAIDVEKFQVKFDPPLRDVTLGQFFDALVRVAEPPAGAQPAARLKYSVEDYAVVFSPDLGETNGAGNAAAPNSASSAGKGAESELYAAAREKVMRKLDTIRIDDFPLVEPVDLIEVLKELRVETKKRDPEGHGINFVIDKAKRDPKYYDIDLERFQIKIDPPIRNVTIGQLCDVIVRVGASPVGAPRDAALKYTVTDYGVVFSLREADRARGEPPIRETGPATDRPKPGANRTRTRQELFRTLQTVRIDDFPLPAETELREIVKQLDVEIRKRSTDGSGINFVFAPPRAIPTIDPLTGIPTENSSEPDPGDFKAKFDPPIRDVTLGQFLDAIVMVAQSAQPPPATVGLRYSVEDYGILFSVRSREEQFVSRAFKVNPNTFRQGLESIWFAPQLRATADGTIKSNFQQEIRDFFVAAGVDFPTNNVAVGGAVPREFGIAGPGQQQKAIFFNDRAGVLYVRALLRELDIIENAIHALNTTPPIVSIRVEAAEISNELKLRIEKEIAMANKTTLLATNEFLFVTPKEASGEAVLQGTKSLLEMIKDPVAVAHVTFPAVEAVLAAEDARMLRESLKAAKEVDFLAAPNVTTLLGRGARISAEETRSIVTPKTVKTGGVPAPLGFMVDCLGEDFDGINMRLNCTVNMTEFLEYDKAGDAPLPKFRVRSIGSRAKLAPGSTEAFLMPLATPKRVPVLADIPHLGQLFEAPNDAGRYVLILITPVIVDSAGNLVLPKSN